MARGDDTETTMPACASREQKTPLHSGVRPRRRLPRQETHSAWGAPGPSNELILRGQALAASLRSSEVSRVRALSLLVEHRDALGAPPFPPALEPIVRELLAELVEDTRRERLEGYLRRALCWFGLVDPIDRRIVGRLSGGDRLIVHIADPQAAETLCGAPLDSNWSRGYRRGSFALPMLIETELEPPIACSQCGRLDQLETAQESPEFGVLEHEEETATMVRLREHLIASLRDNPAGMIRWRPSANPSIAAANGEHPLAPALADEIRRLLLERIDGVEPRLVIERVLSAFRPDLRKRALARLSDPGASLPGSAQLREMIISAPQCELVTQPNGTFYPPRSVAIEMLTRVSASCSSFAPVVEALR